MKFLEGVDGRLLGVFLDTATCLCFIPLLVSLVVHLTTCTDEGTLIFLLPDMLNLIGIMGVREKVWLCGITRFGRTR
jgi:hypothetical protein